MMAEPAGHADDRVTGDPARQAHHQHIEVGSRQLSDSSLHVNSGRIVADRGRTDDLQISGFEPFNSLLALPFNQFPGAIDFTKSHEAYSCFFHRSLHVRIRAR